MRIGKVEEVTGLSRKTIRFYEEKGLLKVKRKDNSYREYDEETIKNLNYIILFRRAGISLGNVELWQDGVIGTEEMLSGRLSELKNAAALNGSQARLCLRMTEALRDDGLSESVLRAFLAEGKETEDVLEETGEAVAVGEGESLSLGLDIGTTTVSAAVVSLSTGKSLEEYTLANRSAVKSNYSWEKRQNVKMIADRVKKLADALLTRFPQIRSIGFTGQMHGIVYVGKDGEALSDLYTWEDERAGIKDADGKSVCEKLSGQTGYRLSPGYGLATHVWLSARGQVPRGTEKLCTVMDFLVSSLCGTKPVCHASNAASLGLFDLAAMDFDREAIKKAGIDPKILPETVRDGIKAGEYRGVPVTVALGDNQAGVFGTVGLSPNQVLANFGTGSQVSLVYPLEKALRLTLPEDIEVRPYLGGCVLLTGSALCGGRAYGLWERFFSEYAAACGLPDGGQYEVMNKLAQKGMEDAENGTPALTVCTAFCGTRSHPEKRGSVGNIGESNLTPGAVLAGTVMGMAEELFDLFRKMPGEQITGLSASGNAVRRNPALRLALRKVFGKEPMVSKDKEEAARGAALFAAYVTFPGKIKPFGEQFIKLTGEDKNG